ncbi:MAG TPA: alpha/beta hydrolase [Rhodanobacteraceae bacterium]
MNTLKIKFLIALAAMMAWSFASARSFNLSQPLLCHDQMGSLPINVCAQFNIAYGSDPLQMFDVYMPQTQTENAPVILMVHGGGWYQGDKTDTPVVQNKVSFWVPSGFIFISVNYPLVPQVNPVQEAQSVAQALAYAQFHASDWGADPKKFILMGFSAGGNLVSQLAADPALATSLGAQPWLGTVSLDGAAYDVPEIMDSPHPPEYDQAFGTDVALWMAASPTLQMYTRIAPFFAVCSTQEDAVCSQAQEFVNKAKSYGTNATLLQENMSHGDIDANLGLPSSYTTQVSSFIGSLLYGTVPPRAKEGTGKVGSGAPFWQNQLRLRRAQSTQYAIQNWYQRQRSSIQYFGNLQYPPIHKVRVPEN